MAIEVLYFAALAERAGCRAEVVEVGAEATVAELWSELVRRHPALAGLSYHPLVACDRTWAGWDRTLAAVREVAFVPPLSGG